MCPERAGYYSPGQRPGILDPERAALKGRICRSGVFDNVPFQG